MKIAVLLAGCGVYDGSEIHEAVFSMLAIAENGGEYQCIAPNVNQAHVVNHITGEAMNETRNVLVESARIARGNVLDVDTVSASDFDAIVIPGGFGPAKNITNWAFEGPNGTINFSIKNLIQNMTKAGKPVVALCFSPVVLAKAYQGSGISPLLTLGTDAEPSPYDIIGSNAGLQSVGSRTENKSIREICYDEENKIITAPCYMMEVGIAEVRTNSKMAIDKLFEILKQD